MGSSKGRSDLAGTGQDPVGRNSFHQPSTSILSDTEASLGKPCSLNELNVLVSCASFLKEIDGFPGKPRRMNQPNELVHIPSSGRKLMQRHLSVLQKRPSDQTPDLVSANPSSVTSYPLPNPAHRAPGHSSSPSTAAFPASGPWPLLFPLLRILHFL